MGDVIEHEATPRQSTDVLSMIDKAMDRGLDAAMLTTMVDLHERMQANAARKAFVEAMSAFKSEPVKIEKSRHVNFTTQKGTTDYWHAGLSDVVAAAAPAMARHGLSHTWETAQDGTNVTVSCVIRHVDGHAERTTLSAAPDQSGGKNSIQAVGSTVSYLQRYTFMSAVGLAAHDQDDDARGADVERISEEQVQELRVRMDALGVPEPALCQRIATNLGMASLRGIRFLPAESYERVKVYLDRLIDARAAKNETSKQAEAES